MYRFLKQNDKFRDDISILQDLIKDFEYFIHGEIGNYLYFHTSSPIEIKGIEKIEADFMYLVVVEPELKDISAHYELVNKRVRNKIRELYTLEDELRIHRLRDVEPETFADYNQWCEECRAWGDEQKTLMGFSK